MPATCGMSPVAKQVKEAVDNLTSELETLKNGVFELGNISNLVDGPSSAMREVTTALTAVAKNSAPLNLLDDIVDAAAQLETFLNSPPSIWKIILGNVITTVLLKYGDYLTDDLGLDYPAMYKIILAVAKGDIEGDWLCDIIPNAIVNPLTGLVEELPMGLDISDKNLKNVIAAAIPTPVENFIKQLEHNSAEINLPSVVSRNLDIEPKAFTGTWIPTDLDDIKTSTRKVLDDFWESDYVSTNIKSSGSTETIDEYIERVGFDQFSRKLSEKIQDDVIKEQTNTGDGSGAGDDEPVKSILDQIDDIINYGYIPDSDEISQLAGATLFGASAPPGWEQPDQSLVKLKKYGTTFGADTDDYNRKVADYPENTFWGTERRWFPGWTQVTEPSGAYNDFGLGYSPIWSAPIKITNDYGVIQSKGHHFEFGTPLIWISLVPGGPPVNDPDYAAWILENESPQNIQKRNERQARGDPSAWRRGIRWYGTSDPHADYTGWRHRDLADPDDDGTPWHGALPLLVGKTYFVNYWWHSYNLGYAGFGIPMFGHAPLWRNGGNFGRVGSGTLSTGPNAVFWKSSLARKDVLTIAAPKLPAVNKQYSTFSVKTNTATQIIIPIEIDPQSTGGTIRWYLPAINKDNVPVATDPANRNVQYLSRSAKPGRGLFPTSTSRWNRVTVSRTPGGPANRSEWFLPFDRYWKGLDTDRPYMEMTYYVTDDEDWIYKQRAKATFDPGTKVFMMFEWPGVNSHFYGEVGNIYFEVEREEVFTPLPDVEDVLTGNL